MEGAYHLKEFDTPSFNTATFRLDRPSMYPINRARKDTLNGYDTLKKSVTSATVYVGHLSLSTTEEQIYELFKSCGKIKKVIMGLNAHDQSPTGFCFVIYKAAKGAMNAVKYLNKMKLNGRPIEIDMDSGFEEGRQYGRGENGGQKYQNNTGNGFRRRGGGRFRGGRGGSRGRDRDRHQPNRNYNNYGSASHYQPQYQSQYQPQQYQPQQPRENPYEAPQQYQQQYTQQQPGYEHYNPSNNNQYGNHYSGGNYYG